MVTRLRSIVGVGLIWLLTVAGASATAWFAVDRAGRGLTGGAGSPGSLGSLSAATAIGVVPGRSAGPTAGAGNPSGQASGPSGPSGSPSKTSGSGSESTDSASDGARSASGASGSPSGPASTTTAQDRSVRVAGGQVSLRCTGATILLRVATPDNGWRVEVGGSGPREVALTFKRGEESPDGETQVKAVCANGAPAVTVDSKS